MGQPKRKHIFLISYENEFPGITRSKNGEEYAHCVPCNSDICLTATGKTAITIHFDSAKHKNALRAQKTSENTAEIKCKNEFKVFKKHLIQFVVKNKGF